MLEQISACSAAVCRSFFSAIQLEGESADGEIGGYASRHNVVDNLVETTRVKGRSPRDPPQLMHVTDVQEETIRIYVLLNSAFSTGHIPILARGHGSSAATESNSAFTGSQLQGGMAPKRATSWLNLRRVCLTDWFPLFASAASPTNCTGFDRQSCGEVAYRVDLVDSFFSGSFELRRMYSFAGLVNCV